MTFFSAASLTSDSPAINRIGRFYITRELGRGSVGCVYLGHDPVIARDVALKTFSPRLTPAERIRYEQQFINEARAAGRLCHPNIVTIYDASSEGGTTYIAMEYLQGRELSKYLDKGHCFTPDDTASIAWKIADALDHAHKNEVIHRDIKPANIFMVKENQPKLMDFGIARAPNRVFKEQPEGDFQHTIFRQDNLLGTPNYMSPEQALGKPVDARTDIYSLGAIMYEMLVGHKPFQCDNASKLLQQIAYKGVRAPHEVNPQVPVVLSKIVMKAMNKRPEKRYATAEKMALDIKRYLLRERRNRKRMPLPVPQLPQTSRQSCATIPRLTKIGLGSLLVAILLWITSVAYLKY